MPDTLDFYKNRGFGARPALLIIDFIKGFSNLALPLASNLDQEIAATKKLLSAAQAETAACLHDGRIRRDAGVFINSLTGRQLDQFETIIGVNHCKR